MPLKFDLVVIGSGTAGSVVASKCRAAGWTVAVIDELPFGVTCALRGCDPKTKPSTRVAIPRQGADFHLRLWPATMETLSLPTY